MKIKTVVIALLVTAAAAGGIGYGVYYYTQQSKNTPVNVVPVANVNFGYWGNDSVSYGSIISKDSQSVELSSEYELVKVYVETGDEVKVGDPLLEYDMTLTELKNEMEELTKQSLELNLQTMEKELKKLQNTTPTASLDINSGIMTASDDGLFEDMGTVEVENPNAVSGEDFIQTIPETQAPQIESSGNTNQNSSQSGSDLIEDSSGNNIIQEPSDGDTSQNPSGNEENLNQSGDDQTEPENGDASGDLIVDGETTPEGDTENSGDLILDDDASEEDQIIDNEENGNEEAQVDEVLIVTEINNFLTRVNLLSAQELDQLIYADISEALRIYQEKLAVSQTEELVDVFGEARTITLFALNPAIASVVGESTAEVLEQAYDRVCFYHFVYCMQQLNQESKSVDEMTDEEVRALETSIRTAADAYYALREDVFTNEEYREILAARMEELSGFIARLNHMDVVEETEPSTEQMTELPSGDFGDLGDFGDFGDLGDGVTYTAEELKEAIADQQRSIAECKLEIRESELKLKQYARELDKKIVKSNMNGVVKSAGTLDDTIVGEAFIVITGETGMYVQGTISELKLETVEIGDVVQGTSYDAGIGFTAIITEISPYPVDNDSFYFGYGSENSNSSYYPFLAYIEDAEGLVEGEVELQIVENTPSTGIYLEKYFILEEKNGKEYVYLQGSDGLLKKQYVQTGITIYGMAKEIQSGISENDKIAFPYGKNVVEGAPTREVDNLYSDYMYYG